MPSDSRDAIEQAPRLADDPVGPEVKWNGAPTARRGQQSYRCRRTTPAVLQVLSGMIDIAAHRFERDVDAADDRSAGLTAESLLRLIGLGWTAPDFSTLSRRQKALAVNIACRGSKAPLNLLIDSTGIRAEGKVARPQPWRARTPRMARNHLGRKRCASKSLAARSKTMERLPPPVPRRDEDAPP